MFPDLRRLLTILLWALLLWDIASAQERGRYAGARETVYPEWFKDSFLDLREDITEAAENGRRVMIFFHQDGCPYCHLMVERNLSQRTIQDVLRRQMDVIELNIFGDREVTALDGQSTTEKAFAAALGVQFTPTLLFFDEQGEVVLRLNGYIPPQSFQLALNYVTGHMESELSYRRYLENNRPTAPQGELNPEDYHRPPPYNLAVRSGKPLAVFFEQVQCPDCDRLHHEVLVDSQIRELLGRYDVVQLDMWSNTPLITFAGEQSDARSLARELGVTFAPTFILFDPQGREVLRSEAIFKQFHTASILDYVVSGAYLEQPNFQRYIAARAERLREQGQDVDIWK
ncbi:MAG: thioredoxin fold domain-containing protein [Gammaproteobacteria bacterium]|nr:thioredoxin fold domain-containing protein [Gammaproteobacteria bacterium]